VFGEKIREEEEKRKHRSALRALKNFRKMLENSKRLLLNLEILRTKDYLDYVRKGKN